jgi:hypothetical protein
MAKDKKNKVEEAKEEVTELENLNVSPEENQEIKLDEAPVDNEETKEETENTDSTEEEIGDEVPEEENLEEENQEIKLDEAPEEDIEVIDMNNKPVSLLAKGDVTAPRGFIPVPNKTKIGEFGCCNGRTFQVIGKDVAVWCDNGKQFSLSSIE